MTESLLFSAAGGACGLGLALVATRLFAAWNPLNALPSTPIRIDARALAFAAAAMALTTIVSGLLPALRVGAIDPNDALRSGGDRGPTGARDQRAQSLLLAAQIAVGCADRRDAAGSHSRVCKRPLGRCGEPDGGRRRVRPMSTTEHEAQPRHAS